MMTFDYCPRCHRSPEECGCAHNAELTQVFSELHEEAAMAAQLTTLTARLDQQATQIAALQAQLQPAALHRTLAAWLKRQVNNG